jgi:phosphoglycerate kinase
MMSEINFLGPAINFPAKPFVLIMGGAKISSKLPLLTKLMTRCDRILVGGGMAFTLLKAIGFVVGKSMVEDSLLQAARDMVQLAEKKQVELVLPRDVVVTTAVASDIYYTVPVSEIPSDMMGVDVGPATIKAFCAELDSARTILWNGKASHIIVSAHHRFHTSFSRASGYLRDGPLCSRH